LPFLCRTYVVAPAAEDDVVTDLWIQGTLGVSVEAAPAGQLRLRAYFPSTDGKAMVIPAAVLETEELLEDRDWLELFRSMAEPFELGEQFLVDPGEPHSGPLPAAPGRRLLQLPARAAFGTGSHESTALAVELLETVAISGARVLDVGTGTGVLALAALALGAGSAVAFDLDPASPFDARDNARRNGLSLPLFTGTLAALGSSSFDLVLANLIAEQLLPELKRITELLQPAGAAILSGILSEGGSMIVDQAGRLGFEVRAERRRGEWAAFVIGPRDSSP
jgi:ribosomal protein L11 methyltransferase